MLRRLMSQELYVLKHARRRPYMQGPGAPEHSTLKGAIAAPGSSAHNSYVLTDTWVSNHRIASYQMPTPCAKCRIHCIAQLIQVQEQLAGARQDLEVARHELESCHLRCTLQQACHATPMVPHQGVQGTHPCSIYFDQ